MTLRLDTLTFIRRTLWLGLALVCAGPRLGVAADHVPPEIVRAGLSPAELGAAQHRLHDSLAAEMPSALAPPIRVTLSSEQRRELQQTVPTGPGPVKIGMVKKFSPGLVVSGFDRQKIAKRGSAVSGGTLQSTDDGGFVWGAAGASPG